MQRRSVGFLGKTALNGTDEVVVVFGEILTKQPKAERDSNPVEDRDGLVMIKNGGG